MKKITCSVLCCALAGTLLSGCGLPGLDSSQSETNSMSDSYSTDADNTQKEQEYSWVLEPTVSADNIITFDGSQVDSDDEQNNDYANYSVIRLNGKYGLIDYSGKIIAEPTYEDFYTCWCGEITLFNTVDEKNGIYEYCSVDSSNQIVNYAPKHTDNSPEYFWDENAKKVYVKNKNEDYAVEFESKKTVAVRESQSVEDIGNGRFAITPKENSLYGLAKKDQLISEIKYTDCYAPAYKGAGLTCIALKNSDGKWGYVDSSGKTIIDFKCDGDASAYCGHLIDSQEKEHPYLFSGKYVPVVIDGTYSYYDMEGNCVVSQGEFEQARPLHNGKAWVRKNGLWGVIQIGETIEDESSVTETTDQTQNYTQQYYYTTTTASSQQTTTSETTQQPQPETSAPESASQTQSTQISSEPAETTQEQQTQQSQPVQEQTEQTDIQSEPAETTAENNTQAAPENQNGE